MPSRLSNSDLVYLDGILVASTIVIFESEINIGFERAIIFPTEGRLSSLESGVSASSEGSAVQPDERDRPAARRP